jgi:hypothetical protein
MMLAYGMRQSLRYALRRLATWTRSEEVQLALASLGLVMGCGIATVSALVGGLTGQMPDRHFWLGLPASSVFKAVATCLIFGGGLSFLLSTEGRIGLAMMGLGLSLAGLLWVLGLV